MLGIEGMCALTENGWGVLLGQEERRKMQVSEQQVMTRARESMLNSEVSRELLAWKWNKSIQQTWLPFRSVLDRS